MVAGLRGGGRLAIRTATVSALNAESRRRENGVGVTGSACRRGDGLGVDRWSAQSRESEGEAEEEKGA